MEVNNIIKEAIRDSYWDGYRAGYFDGANKRPMRNLEDKEEDKKFITTKNNDKRYWVFVIYENPGGSWLCPHTTPYLTKEDAEKVIDDVYKKKFERMLASFIQEEDDDGNTNIVSLKCYIDALGNTSLSTLK